MGGEHHPAGHRLMRAAPISSQVQDTASPLQGRGFEDVEARERGGRLGAVVSVFFYFLFHSCVFETYNLYRSFLVVPLK